LTRSLTLWRLLFQKRILSTVLDIYVFITMYTSADALKAPHPPLGLIHPVDDVIWLSNQLTMSVPDEDVAKQML